MSKQYPECPLYNHLNCREIDNRKVCAIVREDNVCLKKLHKNVKKPKNKETAIQIKNEMEPRIINQ
jgi:hypothetical protein